MALSGVSNVFFVFYSAAMLAKFGTLCSEQPEAVPRHAPTMDTEVRQPPVSKTSVHFPEVHPDASQLNRYIFQGNVLHGTGDQVKHWMVIFCTDWHEKCKGLVPSYELLGAQWEEKLNAGDIFQSSVRFAKVDCATDKELCNSQGIEDYPTVTHYQHGKAIGTWAGGAPGLVRWVKQELTNQKRPKSPPGSAPRRLQAAQEPKRSEGAIRAGQGVIGFSAHVPATSCGAAQSEVFHEQLSHPSPAPPERQAFTMVTGFFLILIVGIGHVSTPQLLGPRQRPPHSRSPPDATAGAGIVAHSHARVSADARPAIEGREALRQCIPEERVSEHQRFEL